MQPPRSVSKRSNDAFISPNRSSERPFHFKLLLLFEDEFFIFYYSLQQITAWIIKNKILWVEWK